MFSNTKEVSAMKLLRMNWIPLLASLCVLLPMAACELEDAEEDTQDDDDAEIVARVKKLSTPFVSGQGYPYYRQPAIVKAKNGDLLAFAQGRSRKSDDSTIDIVLRRSKDEGRSWRPRQLIAGSGTRDPVKNVSPVVLDSGRVIILYLKNRYVEDENERGCRRVYMKYSDDHGKTWSKKRDITRQTQKPCIEDNRGRFVDPPPRGHWGWTGLGPVHGIVKKKAPHRGRIIFAARHLAPDSRTYPHVIYSDDDGDTWRIGGSGSMRSTETTVVEQMNGDIMINSRSPGSTNRRVVAVSEDGGESFGPSWVEHQLPEPGGVQGCLLQHSTNPRTGEKNILFSNPRATDARHKNTLQLSTDSGYTWSKRVRYSPAGEFSAYSGLVKLSGGHIGVLYEHGPNLDKTHREIIFKVITKGELGL